jgi:tyrosinase
MITRKNLRNLTSEEIDTLRNAFSGMYADKQQRYQSFTNILLNYGHATQNDLNFLTWNRAFFNAFEQLLLEYAPGFGLPYWDYTEEESINSGLPDFISEAEYETGDGNTAPNPLFQGPGIIKMVTLRDTKPSPSPILKGALELANSALEEKTYQNFTFQLFPVDVASHIWVGGSMTDLNAAPFDPLFWFSHCNLDRYWNSWQQKQADLGKKTMPATVLSAKLKPFEKASKGKLAMLNLFNKTDKPVLYLTGDDVINIEDLGYCYDS